MRDLYEWGENLSSCKDRMTTYRSDEPLLVDGG
jgi:hypothetical protein